MKSYADLMSNIARVSLYGYKEHVQLIQVMVYLAIFGLYTSVFACMKKCCNK